MIDKTENIQIQCFNRTLYFDNIFLAHFITFCIFNNGNGTIQLVQLQIMINLKTHSCLNMIQYKALVNSTNIQHLYSTSIPSNVRISAIRTYTPFCTCVK